MTRGEDGEIEELIKRSPWVGLVGLMMILAYLAILLGRGLLGRKNL